jgi:acyl carrier protein
MPVYSFESGGAMDRTEILQKILELLSHYQGRGANRIPLTESSSLVDELNINSARMVDIVLDLEEKFGVAIDDNNLPKLAKVSDVVSLVDGLLNVKQGS